MEILIVHVYTYHKFDTMVWHYGVFLINFQTFTELVIFAENMTLCVLPGLSMRKVVKPYQLRQLCCKILSLFRGWYDIQVLIVF